MKSFMTFAIVTAVAVMLVASAAATEDAFAGRKRRKNTTKHYHKQMPVEMINYHTMYSVQIVVHRFKAMRTHLALRIIKQAAKTKTGCR